MVTTVNQSQLNGRVALINRFNMLLSPHTHTQANRPGCVCVWCVSCVENHSQELTLTFALDKIWNIFWVLLLEFMWQQHTRHPHCATLRAREMETLYTERKTADETKPEKQNKPKRNRNWNRNTNSTKSANIKFANLNKSRDTRSTITLMKANGRSLDERGDGRGRGVWVWECVQGS